MSTISEQVALASAALMPETAVLEVEGDFGSGVISTVKATVAQLRAKIWAAPITVANRTARLAVTGVFAGQVAIQTAPFGVFCLVGTNPALPASWRLIGALSSLLAVDQSLSNQSNYQSSGLSVDLESGESYYFEAALNWTLTDGAQPPSYVFTGPTLNGVNLFSIGHSNAVVTPVMGAAPSYYPYTDASAVIHGLFTTSASIINEAHHAGSSQPSGVAYSTSLRMTGTFTAASQGALAMTWAQQVARVPATILTANSFIQVTRKG